MRYKPAPPLLCGVNALPLFLFFLLLLPAHIPVRLAPCVTFKL